MLRILLAGALSLCLTAPLAGLAQQGAGGAAGGARAFAPENAILDTSIPFAIGAREARQELRGSFGWPTFQEGIVNNVYFRFDPDGYARFSPTPRLDQDVFEVVCRPGSFNCLARKGGMTMMLNGRGAFELSFADVAQGDTFLIAEGLTELEIPDRILEPLDSRFEALLAAGGELIIRRGEMEVDRYSLVGIFEVMAYLRWITAQQDYLALPQGWPVPNATGPAATGPQLTLPNGWAAPMPQPQQIPVMTADGAAAPGRIQSTTSRAAELQAMVASITDASPMAGPDTTMAPTVVQAPTNATGEVQSLEEVLARLGGESPMPQATATMAGDRAAEIAALQAQADALMAQIAALQGGGTGQQAAMTGQSMTTTPPSPAPSPGRSPADIARQFEYLMTEFGLDARTAFMLIELREEADRGMATTLEPEAVGMTSDARLLEEILAELEGDPSGTSISPLDQTEIAGSDEEFQLLTDYFQSVLAGN